MQKDFWPPAVWLIHGFSPQIQPFVWRVCPPVPTVHARARSLAFVHFAVSLSLIYGHFSFFSPVNGFSVSKLSRLLNMPIFKKSSFDCI